MTNAEQEPASGSAPTEPALAAGGSDGRGRLMSLDAFRGFDIAAMLFVNMTWNREVFHPQFFHVEWNDPLQGATFTDLVFPWFLFIAGCAIPLSMRSGRGRATPWWRKMLTAARRGAVLYLLGVLLTVASKAYGSPLTWKDWFSWNILQLIGAGYFAAVCVYLLPRWAQISFIVAVLVAKTALVFAIPADWVRGVMAAAGHAPRVAETAGVDGVSTVHTGAGTLVHMDDIKRLLHLEHAKIGEGATVWNYVIGWLGMAQQWLPLAAVAVMGGLLTEVLVGAGSAARRLGVVLAWGAVLIALAYLLQAGYRVEGGGWLGLVTQPFSKWVFTASYCLLAAGTGAVILAALWWVIDVKGWTTLWVLRVWGVNAIVLYVGAELSFKIIFSKWQIIHPNGYSGAMAGGFIAWVQHWAAQLGAGDWWALAWGGWVFVIGWLALWWVVCWVLWRKKVFVRV